MDVLFDIIARIVGSFIASFFLLLFVGFILQIVCEDWLKKFADSKEHMSVIKGMFFFGAFICFLVSFFIPK